MKYVLIPFFPSIKKQSTILKVKMLVSVAASIIALVGVIIAAFGWWGRRLDDHSVCCACGFDLFGATLDCVRCPECGAQLESIGAVSIGNRCRRRGPLVAGLLMLGVSSASLGIGGLLSNLDER